MTTPTKPEAIILGEALDWLTHPSKAETEVYLLRHGRTEGNARRVMIGSTDLPLDEVGEAQALRLGQRMKQISFDTLLASPMLRARQTAKAVSEATGHEIVIAPGFEEIDTGDVEGMSLVEIAETYPDLAEILEEATDTSLAWPGGETRLGFNERVLAALLGVLAEYQGQTVAIVCHGAVITSLTGRIFGGGSNDFITYGVDNCSVTHLHIGPAGTRVHRFNERTHLND